MNQHIDEGQKTLHEAGRLTREGLRIPDEDLEDTSLAELADCVRSIRQMPADLSERGEHYQSLEPPVAARPIHLGSVVTLSIGAHEETYQVVRSVEADALKGRISEESPLGNALLGHAAGDQVRWRSPVGVHQARITTVG